MRHPPLDAASPPGQPSLMNPLRIALVSAALCWTTAPVQAASSRMDHRFGVTLDNRAYPSVAGASLGINATDFLRVSAHWGTILFYSSVGASLTALLPEQNFTPTLSLGVSHQYGGFANNWIAPPVSRAFVTAGLGVEWTASFGFHLAGGAQFRVLEGDAPSVMPTLSLGWYF